MTSHSTGPDGSALDNLAAVLAADLDALVVGLDTQGMTLADRLADLWRDFRFAVDSALGFTIEVRRVHEPVIALTQADGPIEPTDVGCSLRMPMDRHVAVRADYTITYYARRPGALVDLGADLAYALDLPLDAAVFDHPLGTATIEPGITGLAAFSTINRAIGVLIEQGLDPDTAQARFSVDRGPSGVLAEADAVLRSSIRDEHGSR